MTFVVALGNSNGKLTTTCSSISVTVGGGKMDGFPSEFSLTTTEVAQFIQEAVTKEINTNLDALLANFPMLFKVEPKLGLCILLTLTSNPQFLASGIMSSDFLGSVVDCSSPQQPPFSPQSPLPDVVVELQGQNF